MSCSLLSFSVWEKPVTSSMKTSHTQQQQQQQPSVLSASSFDNCDFSLQSSSDEKLLGNTSGSCLGHRSLTEVRACARCQESKKLIPPSVLCVASSDLS
ncbi:hypothetical protein E2C01_070032 [Portunus trituberculatus]|uniref:Uncharacterized protein n=1 Tax=Portunus trituberculatus TaxID=210409 RepID=A0A5B7I162_PORTR|nr:hypothetical protein [Portunus trituberculatus]